eukprot:7385026-Prymnesium_polylepis.1
MRGHRPHRHQHAMRKQAEASSKREEPPQKHDAPPLNNRTLRIAFIPGWINAPRPWIDPRPASAGSIRPPGSAQPGGGLIQRLSACVWIEPHATWSSRRWVRS